MSHDTDKLIRQLSLVAFLMAERRPLTARDVKSNVEGYSEMSDEAFARRFRKRVGDIVRLSTPQGAIDLPILARYFDMNFSNMGLVLVDLSLYQRVWGDHALHVLEPILKRGGNLDHLEAEIRQRWATRYGMRILRLDEFRNQVRAEVAGSSAFYGARKLEDISPEAFKHVS